MLWTCLAAGSVIPVLIASTAPMDITSTRPPTPAKHAQSCLPAGAVPQHLSAYNAQPTISSTEQAVPFAQ